MEKNTPELWDGLWKETSREEDAYNLIREEKGIRWKKIEKIILKKFGTFKNLKVIEVGAGAGTNALLFAKRGAKITILDYSKKAIARSREFFKRNNCLAEFILADALKLPKKSLNAYDVSMSFGLAEHFTGENRKRIVKSHLDLLKSPGLAIIAVPNKLNPPYRIYKFLMQLIKKWPFGEEYPYSRKEFSKIASPLNLKALNFIGDSFYNSFRFINPFLLFPKFRKKDIKKIKTQKTSILDDYFAYSLLFIGEK